MPTTPQAHQRRHGRIPDEADPHHGGQRLRHRRRAAGAAVRGAVRLRAGAAGRTRQAGGRASRHAVAGAVQDHGHHHQAGAAGRAGRHRLHRRQVRHRLAEAARHAGGAVLRLGDLLRVVVLGAGDAHVGLQPLQAAALPARGAGHRVRHHLVRQRAAADHGQAAAHGHPRLDRGPGDSRPATRSTSTPSRSTSRWPRCSSPRPPTRRSR